MVLQFFNIYNLDITIFFSNFASLNELNDKAMRFYKQVWGIIWEFNSIWEYVQFLIGRLIGTVIFIVIVYLLYKYYPL